MQWDAKGKVESLYFYLFLTKLKCLCVILINVINIIKLTFNTIRWSCWSPFQITVWMRPWNASCFSIFCTYRDENKEPASLDLLALIPVATQLWLWMASWPWRETSTNFLLSCCQLHYCQWCGSLFHPDLTWSYRHPAQSKNCLTPYLALL